MANKKLIGLDSLAKFAQEFSDEIDKKTNDKLVTKADKSELFSKDYNDLTNKPFYETSELKLFTNDGDNTGRLIVNNGTTNIKFAKISEDEIDSSSIDQARFFMFVGDEGYEISDPNTFVIVENETGSAINLGEYVVCTFNDNFAMDMSGTIVTFPEKGLYFSFNASGSHAWRLDNVYLPIVSAKQLDEKFIPDTIARTDTIISIQNSLGDKQDKLTYKDTTMVYKRIESENSINSFDNGEGIFYCVIESLNLKEDKTYNAEVLAEHLFPMSLNEPESLVDNTILLELESVAQKDEWSSSLVGTDVISLSFLSDDLPGPIFIYDKVSINSADSDLFYAEDRALVLFGDYIHYIDIGVEEYKEVEISNEIFDTYKFVTEEEKNKWNNKIEYSDLEEIYSSLEDINAIANEKLLYSEYFNTIEIDSMTNSTYEYRGFLAYKNVDGLLGIEVDTYYDLELTFNDDSVVRYSKLLSDYTKNIRHDDGNIIINVGDDTFVSNNGSVDSYPGVNKHSVYGYNITNLKQVKIYKSSEVTDEFLEIHRFITEEERVNWNSKQDKEDANLNTENKTIVGAINEVKTNKADKSEMFSGSYNDLTDKPEIPSIKGLATEEFVTNLNNDVVESINEINTELETKASTEFVNNILSGLTLMQLTQAEYDALEEKSSNVLYIIIG